MYDSPMRCCILTETKGNIMQNIEQLIETANNSFEAGFTTMTQKKETLSNLGRAFEHLVYQIQELVLNIDRNQWTKEHDDIYWELPALHVWKPKHTALVLNTFPNAKSITDKIEQLVDFRVAVKNADVVKVERNAQPEIITKIQTTIRNRMEIAKAKYAHGLKLQEIFGKLNVSVNVHYVVNQHGTGFIRAFYYMNGILTPLNVIIAVMQESEKK